MDISSALSAQEGRVRKNISPQENLLLCAEEYQELFYGGGFYNGDLFSRHRAEHAAAHNLYIAALRVLEGEQP